MYLLLPLPLPLLSLFVRRWCIRNNQHGRFVRYSRELWTPGLPQALYNVYSKSVDVSLDIERSDYGFSECHAMCGLWCALGASAIYEYTVVTAYNMYMCNNNNFLTV